MAGVCFTARPFLGLRVLKHYKETRYQLIIAKAFLQARPEYLDDAEKRKAAVSYKLANPPAKLHLSIGSLLALLFSFALCLKHGSRYITQHCLYWPSGTKIYLFTGRLII